MKISYAIPVCNEYIELEKLLSFLIKYIDENDEIIVQCDQGNTTPEVYKVLDSFKAPVGLKDPLKVIEFTLNCHFSNFKCDYKNNNYQLAPRHGFSSAPNDFVKKISDQYFEALKEKTI